MPYKLVTAQDADGATVHCIEKKGGGRVDGSCHKDEAMTKKMMAALYASDKAFKDAMAEDDDLPSLEALIGADVKATKPAAEDEPAEPEADAESPAEDEQGAAVGTVNVPKGITRLVLNLTKALGRKDAPSLFGGFKVYTDSSGADRWLAWYSNNFEDRDGELFSEKGIDQFVARVDMGVVPLPELWSWHTPGTRYGRADWVDRIGHYAVASGTYDDTPAGRAGKAYDKAHGDDYEVSHGFFYTKSGVRVLDDGTRVYDDFNTFEVSPLPRGKAANVFTAFAVESIAGIKEAVVSPEKQQHLIEKFGKDYVDKLIADTATRGKAIEELAGYKDFVHPEGENEAAANKQAVENADANFGELMPQLVEDAGEAVMASLQAVKAARAQDVKIAEMMQTIGEMQKAIREYTSAKPRSASKDATTVIDESNALLAKSQLGTDEGLKEALPGLYKS